MLNIIKKELIGYFYSPLAYLFIISFLVIIGIMTFIVSDFFAVGEASLGNTFFSWHPIFFAFFIPAIGMRSWAEENKNGTLELLLSMPTSLWKFIFCKYLAALIVVLLTLLGTFPIVWTVGYLGSPDYGVIAASYLGCLLLASAFISVTSACSAFVSSQVLAYIYSTTICVILVAAGLSNMLNEFMTAFPNSQWIVNTVSAIGISDYFLSFRKGLIELKSINYFIIISISFLFATYCILQDSKK